VYSYGSVKNVTIIILINLTRRSYPHQSALVKPTHHPTLPPE